MKVRCVIVDDEPVAREILASYIDKVNDVELVTSCKNGVEALSVLHKESIDLIFLDINMPEITGLTLAKSIHPSTRVIFTTAYREYALDGFDLQAIDYLLKPISFDRFLKAIQKYFDMYGSKLPEKEFPVEKEMTDGIFVRSDRKMIKVRFQDIYHIESLSDYIKIFTHDQVIITRETISNIESKLPRNEFLRTHRSYIVSLARIVSYTNEFVEVGQKAIPISRSYKENVLSRLQN